MQISIEKWSLCALFHALLSSIYLLVHLLSLMCGPTSTKVSNSAESVPVYQFSGRAFLADEMLFSRPIIAAAQVINFAPSAVAFTVDYSDCR